MLGALKRTLRRTCRRTRIDPLEVGVIFAGDDPADTAQTYGYANAALWTLMPKLEELFYILIIHIRQFLSTFVLLFVWL